MKKIILVTGKIGAGKTTLATWAEKTFDILRLNNNELREEIGLNKNAKFDEEEQKLLAKHVLNRVKAATKDIILLEMVQWKPVYEILIDYKPKIVFLFSESKKNLERTKTRPIKLSLDQIDRYETPKSVDLYLDTVVLDINEQRLRFEEFFRYYFLNEQLSTRTVKICLTSRCNIDCIYCHNESQKDKCTDIDIAELKKFIDVIKDLGFRKIKFTGGEPLLYKDILEALSYAHSKDIICSLTTNGVLFDERLQLRFKPYLNKVVFSIDSLKKNGFTKLTKTAFSSREVVLENFILAKKNMQKLSVNSVLTSLNKDDVINLSLFCRDNCINYKILELIKSKENEGLFLDLSDVEKILLPMMSEFYFDFVDNALIGKWSNGSQVSFFHSIHEHHDGDLPKRLYFRLTSDFKLRYDIMDEFSISIKGKSPAYIKDVILNFNKLREGEYNG